MSHQIETMMYAGMKPWHNLGTFVGDEDVDSATALKASGLNWKVKKVPLVARFSHEKTGKLVEAPTDEYFGIVRNIDCKVLGIVQGRYEVYQNEECFEFMDTVAGPTGQIAYNTAGSLRGGKVVWLLAKFKELYSEPVKGDLSESYILLSTSHDGTSSLRVLFVTLRVVCANTLAMATAGRSKEGIKIRHTGDLKDKVKQAQDILGLVVDEHGKYNEVCTYLANLKLDSTKTSQFMDEFLPVPEKKNPSRTLNVREKILDLFESGLGTDIPGVRGTGWGMYNAVTEYLNHYKTYRNTGGNNANDNRLYALWYGQSAEVANKAKKVLLEMA